GQRTLGFSITVIAGAVVSATVTLEAQEAALPSSSVPVKVTVVVPRGSRPGASWPTAGVASHRSATAAPPRNAVSWASAEDTPPWRLHSTVTGAGQWIDGLVVSTTVTTALSVPELPPSDTTRITVVAPFGNAPVGCTACGSSKTMPDADQVNVSASPCTSLEALPSSVTGVVACEAHSTTRSGPASANGPPSHSEHESLSPKLTLSRLAMDCSAPLPTRSR